MAVPGTGTPHCGKGQSFGSREERQEGLVRKEKALKSKCCLAHDFFSHHLSYFYVLCSRGRIFNRRKVIILHCIGFRQRSQRRNVIILQEGSGMFTRCRANLFYMN